jgi:hypothetical protein
LPSAVALLDKAGVHYAARNQEVSFTTDSKTLTNCANAIFEFTKISKAAYAED